jgi:flagellar basal-body rod protein FlgC
VDYSRAVAISAAGMAAQKARIEAAMLNIANMHTSAPPGSQGYRPVTAVITAAPTPFSRALFSGTPQLTMAQAVIVPQSGATTRTSYEPGHPHADAQGMVSYPAVDPTQEMLTVMTALRSYEANLAALQATRTLAVKALEIGGP